MSSSRKCLRSSGADESSTKLRVEVTPPHCVRSSWRTGSPPSMKTRPTRGEGSPAASENLSARRRVATVEGADPHREHDVAGSSSVHDEGLGATGRTFRAATRLVEIPHPCLAFRCVLYNSEGRKKLRARCPRRPARSATPRFGCSHGMDEDYTFSFSEDELRRAAGQD